MWVPRQEHMHIQLFFMLLAYLEELLLQLQWKSQGMCRVHFI